MLIFFLSTKALTAHNGGKEERRVVKTEAINSDLLEEMIQKSGLKTAYICEQLGISKQAFYQKRKGEVAFRQSEVYVLCDLLRIADESLKNDIFSLKMSTDK